MNTLATLRTLAGGDPVAAGILGDCRLESGNVDAFGVEAVADSFRQAPMIDAVTAIAVEARGGLAIFGATEAIVADRFGDAVGRLWRVGHMAPGTPEPAVAVAFDTDLRQARAAVFIDAADHPGLDGAALERLMALGCALVYDRAPEFAAFRGRAFAVRAFGDVTRGAALFAIHALAVNPVRTPHLTFAAVHWDGAATRIIRDPIRPRVESIRIAS